MTDETVFIQIDKLREQNRELKKEIIKLKSLNRRAAEEIRDLDGILIDCIENNKVPKYDDPDPVMFAGFSSINLLNRLEGRTNGGYVDNYIDVFTDEELASYMDAAVDSSPGMAMLIWEAVGNKDQERIIALHKLMNTAKFVELVNSLIAVSARADHRDYRYFRHVGESARLIDGSLALEPFQDGKTTVLKNGSVQDQLSVSSELK